MALVPEFYSGGEGVDFLCFPPPQLIATVVEIAVMSCTEGDGELIGNFSPHGCGLRKLQVMGLGWLAVADEAGL